MKERKIVTHIKKLFMSYDITYDTHKKPVGIAGTIHRPYLQYCFACQGS